MTSLKELVLTNMPMAFGAAVEAILEEYIAEDNTRVLNYLLGGLLSSKEPSYDEWSSVIVHANNAKGDIFPLIYQDLPSEIKPCFLYMGIFPKGFEIPVRRLIHLWSAEGFLMPPDPELIDPEDLAEMCFEQLIIRNVVQVRWKLDGHPKMCRIPSFLYDFFTLKAEAAGLFNHQLHTSSQTSTKQSKVSIRRLAAYFGVKNLCSSLSYNVQGLRSYVAFDTRMRGTAARDTCMFLRKIVSIRGFGLLNVLDLEGVYKPMLCNDVVGKLLQLSYLGLRSTFIDNLPYAVSVLPRKHITCLSGGFPKLCLLNLWKLPLQHWTVEEEGAMPCLNELEIRDCYNMKPPEGLKNVTTLKELVLTNMPMAFGAAVEEILQDRNVLIKTNTWCSSPLLRDNNMSNSLNLKLRVDTFCIEFSGFLHALIVSLVVPRSGNIRKQTSSMIFPIVSSLIYSIRRTVMELYSPSYRKLWKEWDLRAMVLLSLTLQILLSILDSVATFALGILSSNITDMYGDNTKSIDGNTQLTAFWAPFLLLHLGGPDSITAYTLEDNELWLRHSWTSFPDRNGTLRLSHGLDRSASNTKRRNSMLRKHDFDTKDNIFHNDYKVKIDAGYIVGVDRIVEVQLPVNLSGSDNNNSISDEDKLLTAYGLLNISKRLFVDATLNSRDRDTGHTIFRNLLSEDAFEVIETELRLIYELLYTEMSLFYTPWG
ncbi:hypothetical protein QYF36_010072 [Acer negundo]|nr:hypothetical protein QYF36_010072 [Acer negundo]